MAINRKLGKRTDQRVELVYSQASELLWHGKIETTVERAKEARKVAEKMITLAMNTYKDVVEVTKTKTNLKDEKIEVAFTNDGPTKLAARRKMIAALADYSELQGEKEKKAAYKDRTKEIASPLIEKMFREYGPKYAERAETLGQRGGYTRIIRLGKRRGDDADMCILELV
ncbi:MAG: 50S ribosomal protein L17 [Bacillota bacterium]